MILHWMVLSERKTILDEWFAPLWETYVLPLFSFILCKQSSANGVHKSISLFMIMSLSGRRDATTKDIQSTVIHAQYVPVHSKQQTVKCMAMMPHGTPHKMLKFENLHEHSQIFIPILRCDSIQQHSLVVT